MIPGLDWTDYEHLCAVALGAPSKAGQAVVTHCACKGWVRGGRLTDDGRAVLARAKADPPPKASARSVCLG